jgi:hypothetical protein
MTEVRTPTPPDLPVGRPSGRIAPAALATDPAAKAAATEVAAARAALTDELVTLRASARAAVDVKARVRRNVGKTAAAVGGAAFLAVGGPRRAFRAVKRRVVGEPEPLPASLLPEEVEKAVRALGDDGAKVRGALERGFAGWLGATAKDRKAEDRQRSVVNLAMKIGVPAASRAAREVVSRALRETAAGARPGSGDDRPGGGKPAR